MADPKLPGLNYGTPITINDLENLEVVYTSEFITRTLAMVGSYRLGGASFGILSEVDPSNASSSVNPLFVEQTPTDDMRVDVHPGIALAENGMMIKLLAKAESLEMVNQTIGQANVVFIEYLVIEDEDTIVSTRFNTSEARVFIPAPDTAEDPTDLRVLQVASMQDWTNDLLFPPDRRKNVVAVALVNIVSSEGTLGKEVDVDLLRTTLAANRPWFSPVDIAHRAEQGTGSSSVPHSLGLNDLSQGDLTLYEQLLNHGMVLGVDRDASGVPGELCFEVITPARVKIDGNASVTGTASQRYVKLIRYPVRLLGAHSIGDTTNEVLVELMPHTNILLIHQDDVVGVAGIRVQYSTVDAGEPLEDSLINDEVHFRQPVPSRELLIAGGKGLTEINPKFVDTFNNTRAKISLGTSPQIPKRYRILLDSSAQLLQTPQDVLCATKLDDLGTEAFTIDTTMLGNARLRLGLQNVDLNAATVVRFRVVGTDNTGAAVTEDLTFDISNYESPSVGQCEENPKNFRVTNTVFATISTLAVLERTADGPSSAVAIYADLDPNQTDAIRTACPLAEVIWDGNGICRIHDIRPVFSRLETPTRSPIVKVVGQSILATLAAQGTTGIHELVSDDLRDPYKFKLLDPLRFYKFSDGLRTTLLPEQPQIESTPEGADQDVYTSQALRLPPGTSRTVHVAVLGQDSNRFLLNDQDGIAPIFEYRASTTVAPETWTTWFTVASLANASGSNFRFTILDDHFKLQLRVKGSIVGIVAVQYQQLPGSQIFAGIREFAGPGIPSGQSRILAVPFGQSFSNADYEININAYTLESVAAGAAGIQVVRVDKFVDHANVYLSGGPTSGAIRIHWQLDLTPRVATTNEGFGDSIIT